MDVNHDATLETNRRVYDAMAAARDPLCRPATDEELSRPLSVVDQAGWLGGSIVHFLGHLIWFVAAYATPFLATFHSQFTATHLVVFIVVIS